MKKFIVKSYSKKGQDVVDKNFAAVDRGNEYKQLTVDPAWANLPDDEAKVDDAPAFVKELVRPMNAQAGDLLKVSDFVNHGTVDRYMVSWYCCLRQAWCSCFCSCMGC